jgi:hypothetical protein
VFHKLETLRTTSGEELVLMLVNTTGHRLQHAMQVLGHHLQESGFRVRKHFLATCHHGFQ